MRASRCDAGSKQRIGVKCCLRWWVVVGESQSSREEGLGLAGSGLGWLRRTSFRPHHKHCTHQTQRTAPSSNTPAAQLFRRRRTLLGPAKRQTLVRSVTADKRWQFASVRQSVSLSIAAVRTLSCCSVPASARCALISAAHAPEKTSISRRTMFASAPYPPEQLM